METSALYVVDSCRLTVSESLLEKGEGKVGIEQSSIATSSEEDRDESKVFAGPVKVEDRHASEAETAKVW